SWNSFSTSPAAAARSSAFGGVDPDLVGIEGAMTGDRRHLVIGFFVDPQDIVGSFALGAYVPVGGIALERAVSGRRALFEMFEIDVFQRDIEDRRVAGFAQLERLLRRRDHRVAEANRHGARIRLDDNTVVRVTLET